MTSLFTATQRLRLLANGEKSSKDEGFDPKPVVKLFTPSAGAIWLLSELNPSDQGRAFGLCDLGLGCPELGYVSISELEGLRHTLRAGVERDRSWQAVKTLSAYADEARAHGRIMA
ncbi:DUF2958 domain-containing protein [Microvirga flavescens]|uniref:DUF2958 domain-containing protein n=1 Tax=Microvirga flavescens TaxID=2249811 RepID=UPI000DDB0B80|nr:DUF2958 domain-containing protein [Microvirga flavescens]